MSEASKKLAENPSISQGKIGLSHSKLIDIVIPAYNELKLGDTLGKLFDQSIIDHTNIWIVEYDPNGRRVGEKIIEKFAKVNKVDNLYHLYVTRPGIAFARHQGIMNGSAPIICNMDADSYFSKGDSLVRMTLPIIEDEAVLTVCNNVWNQSEIPKDKEGDMRWMIIAMEHLSHSQSIGPWAFLEPGSCMLRQAYGFVGGFADTDKWELFDISGRLFYSYPGMKKYVSDVEVIVSPRRVLNFRDKNLGILNYSNYNPRIDTTNQLHNTGIPRKMPSTKNT